MVSFLEMHHDTASPHTVKNERFYEPTRVNEILKAASRTEIDTTVCTFFWVFSVHFWVFFLVLSTTVYPEKKKKVILLSAASMWVL